MTDFLTKVQRSTLMSAIHGQNNKTTELVLASLFRQNGIKGWRRHFPISGRPDFVFPKQHVAVFVDGCFWHGCPRHYRQPTSNVAFWVRKMRSNKSRDKKVVANLRSKGWKVLRIWEHSLRNPQKILEHIRKSLDTCSPRQLRR